MLYPAGIFIIPYNLPGLIDFECPSAGSAWIIDRTEPTSIIQKTMIRPSGICVPPYNLTGIVDSTSAGAGSNWIIERAKPNSVIQKSILYPTRIPVHPYHLASIIDPIGRGAQGSGDIKLGIDVAHDFIHGRDLHRLEALCGRSVPQLAKPVISPGPECSV